MTDDARKIRVMIVDDHEVVRRGLASYIEEDEGLEVIASVGSGEEALHVCQRVKPDVILMDILMPGGIDGITTASRIKSLYPDTKILALTAHSDTQTIADMMRAGAVGYLLKNTPMDDLHHVIRMIHAGRLTFSPEVANVLMQPGGVQNRYDLTDRELEVLRLLANGLNNPEIADALVISRSTAGFHVSSIIAKLGVNNRVEAAILAVKEHLI